MSLDEFALAIEHCDLGLVTCFNHNLVQEDFLLFNFELGVLELDSVEDRLALDDLCLPYHVDIPLIDLNNFDKFPLLLNKVLFYLLDLPIEFFLLEVQTLLHIFKLCLVHSFINCALKFTKEAIILSFLFRFSFKDKNFASELFNRDQMLLNNLVFSFNLHPTLLNIDISDLGSFV